MEEGGGRIGRVEVIRPGTGDLESLPGVGPSIARHLRDLGIRNAAELGEEDPEDLYRRSTALGKRHIDRCVLYVFRRAVYGVSASDPDPARLKWWAWQDCARET